MKKEKKKNIVRHHKLRRNQRPWREERSDEGERQNFRTTKASSHPRPDSQLSPEPSSLHTKLEPTGMKEKRLGFATESILPPRNLLSGTSLSPVERERRLPAEEQAIQAASLSPCRDATGPHKSKDQR
ncbi:hypothetical protein J5N97_003224 [Dioscorea zingiberensis]|uniref:Uncharacterized protein n=1 Tax=Dioscorea zingiberensis TaxID=325984 RepID=A0A9D5D4A8_9LILI|nr:hypothetical protein J5N97_003224 [Dioscorea zingiberensis]